MEFYILLLIIVAILLMALSIYLYKNSTVPGVKYFVVCLILVGIWNCTYAFELVSHTIESKAIWYIIRMTFILYIPLV